MKINKESKVDEKQVKEFQQKFAEHKKQYCEANTVKGMVYENGSALALLYKEVLRLNQLITTKINQDEQKNSLSKK